MLTNIYLFRNVMQNLVGIYTDYVQLFKTTLCTAPQLVGKCCNAIGMKQNVLLQLNIKLKRF